MLICKNGPLLFEKFAAEQNRGVLLSCFQSSRSSSLEPRQLSENPLAVCGERNWGESSEKDDCRHLENSEAEEEGIMPTYILLSTLTPRGRQTLHKDPDRLEEVNQDLDDFRSTVIAQYAVLGQFDFITVIDAPDNETVAHLTVDLGSRGTVNIVTMPAISIADLRAKLKGPKQMGKA
jgi:uncharacterized protein with GYD domain